MEMNSPDLRSKAVDLLKRIRIQVETLSPPVAAFEKGIRDTPFRILISVLLSSRTRDPVTLAASTRLFSLAQNPLDMARLSREQVENAIFPVGFFRRKAENILEISRRLAREQGRVPKQVQELTQLPGVGRKTANLVRSLAFDIPEVAVDIHVFRISRRLGWAHGKVPEAVESELKQLFPAELWNRINRVLVGFGQTLCRPRNPRCPDCAIREDCTWYTTRMEKRSTQESC
ncbi:MAG TPA: endonuclease III [Candidatus Aminicenantes bacterium]|nr:endonuclease III [Candidatus Aminicenantes bacterium]